MKGTILLGLLDWARADLGEDAVDELLDTAALASDGAYTSVGSYDPREFVAIADAVAAIHGKTRDEILYRYARESFAGLASSHQYLLTEVGDALTLLEVLESHIHVEVMSLYPGSLPPCTRTSRHGDDAMTLQYESSEPLAMVALGNTEGSIAFFHEDRSVSVAFMSEDRRRAVFEVSPRVLP